MTEQRKMLVIGATGHVGRTLVSQLLRTGTAVRAMTRDPGAARLPDSVEVVHGNLSAPDTLHACLEGVTAVFLVWPFLTAEAAPAVLDVVGTHTRRIVYLSAMSVRDGIEEQAGPITAFHARLEQLIAQRGLEWTFLRASGFATNTVGWSPQIRAKGVVRWPYGAAARSLIHERDIAAVAVHVLTGTGHGKATYVLTGPQALTHIEQVHSIGAAIGRPLRYEEISPETARREMLVPPAFADSALAYWATLVRNPEPITSTVQEITGAPAHSFREWADDHADDFR